jgi:hypothetical protein
MTNSSSIYDNVNMLVSAGPTSQFVSQRYTTPAFTEIDNIEYITSTVGSTKNLYRKKNRYLSNPERGNWMRSETQQMEEVESPSSADSIQTSPNRRPYNFNTKFEDLDPHSTPTQSLSRRHGFRSAQNRIVQRQLFTDLNPCLRDNDTDTGFPSSAPPQRVELETRPTFASSLREDGLDSHGHSMNIDTRATNDEIAGLSDSSDSMSEFPTYGSFSSSVKGRGFKHIETLYTINTPRLAMYTKPPMCGVRCLTSTLDPNKRFRRAGIIPYAVFNETRHYLMAIDSRFQELSDFGGQVKYRETFIDAVCRELFEETLGFFDYTSDESKEAVRQSSIAIHDDKETLILFQEIQCRNPTAIIKEYQRRVSKLGDQENSGLLWVPHHMFVQLYQRKHGIIISRTEWYPKMYSLVSDLINIVGGIFED